MPGQGPACPLWRWPTVWEQRKTCSSNRLPDDSPTRGFAVLLFDYRSFGTSGGEPRQRVFPRDQIEDYRSALTWLSLQPQIDSDRLGIWGTSFGGGTVLHVAAFDPRVKAVVSQVGAMDLYQITRGNMSAEQFAGLEQLIIQERVRHATEGGESVHPRHRAARRRPRSPDRPGELGLRPRGCFSNVAQSGHRELVRGNPRTRASKVDRTDLPAVRCS